MAAVEIILGVGILLMLIASLVQCIWCKENERNDSESINNNNKVPGSNARNSVHHEEAGIHNVSRKLPEIPSNNRRNDDSAGSDGDDYAVNPTAGNGVSDIYRTESEVGDVVDGQNGGSNRTHSRQAAHPYAKIPSRMSEDRDTDTDTYDDPQLYANRPNETDGDGNQIYEPPPPPVPEKRYETPEPSTSRNSIPQAGTSAASAVAGRASAVDIPLITPVLSSNQDLYNSSQASELYGRITVRVPLTEVRDRTAVRNQESEDIYTYPGDQDETYEEIYSQNSLHSSNTYSRIDSEHQTHAGDVPPAPPPLESLRSVAQAHSRQASSSSFASETAAAGLSVSGNSETDVLYSKIDKSKKLRNTVHVMEAGPSTSTHNDTEMYAQVQKPRKKVVAKTESQGGSTRYSFATHGSLSHDNSRKSSSEAPSSIVRRSSSKEDPGYERINETPPWNRLSANLEHGHTEVDNEYEVVRPPKGSSYREYEIVRNNRCFQMGPYDEEVEPGYEEVLHNRNNEDNPCDAGYETVGESSFQRSDPNYESLRYSSVPQGTSSRTEPPYWQIQNGPPEVGDPLYERINGQEDDITGVKHGYEKIKRARQISETESVNSEQQDPGYETISSDKTNANKVAVHIAWNNASSSSDYRPPTYLDMGGTHAQSIEGCTTHTNEGAAAFDDSDSLL